MGFSAHVQAATDTECLCLSTAHASAVLRTTCCPTTPHTLGYTCLSTPFLSGPQEGNNSDFLTWDASLVAADRYFALKSQVGSGGSRGCRNRERAQPRAWAGQGDGSGPDSSLLLVVAT